MVKPLQAGMHRQNFIPAGQPVSFSQRWKLARVRGTSTINANILLLSLLRLSEGGFFKINHSFDLSQCIHIQLL